MWMCKRLDWNDAININIKGRLKICFQTALSFEVSLEEFCSDIAESKQAQNGEYDGNRK